MGKRKHGSLNLGPAIAAAARILTNHGESSHRHKKQKTSHGGGRGTSSTGDMNKVIWKKKPTSRRALSKKKNFKKKVD